MEGRERIHSKAGLCFTAVMTVVVLSYAVLKVLKMSEGTGYRVMNAVPNKEGVDLTEMNF